jgi:transposase-like protein
VKGKWVYLYRAVDSHGDTLDFMLSERRDEDAETAFFKQAYFMHIGKYRRAILPHEILGTPVTKYSLTYGANWIA